MKLELTDCINGKNVKVALNATKESKIIEVKGIERLPKEVEAIYLRNADYFHDIYGEYSKDERAKFFRGYPILNDVRKSLTELYRKWNYGYQNGTTDPNYPDGIGLNTIRKTIISEKSRMEKLCTWEEYTKEYFLEVPQLVNDNYIANEKELRKTLNTYADQLEKEPILKEIRDLAGSSKDAYRKMCRADKWGALRNIHWECNLPTIYREVAESDNLSKLKWARKTYNGIVEFLKAEFENAKVMLNQKYDMDQDEETEEDVRTDFEWTQMNLFEWINSVTV